MPRLNLVSRGKEREGGGGGKEKQIKVEGMLKMTHFLRGHGFDYDYLIDISQSKRKYCVMA